MAEQTFEGTVDWTLLPEDPKNPLMPTRWDHSLQEAVEQSIDIHCLRDPVDPTYVEIRVSVVRPPVGLGFNVFRTLDHFIQDIPLEPMAWRPGDFGANVFISQTYCDVDEKTLTILFNPSPAAAANLVKHDPAHLSGLNQIWNGKVVKTVALETSHTRLSRMPGRDMQAVKIKALETLLDPSIIPDQFNDSADINGARQVSKKTVAQNPADLKSRLQEGLLAECGGDWKEAIYCFLAVVAAPRSAQTDRARVAIASLVELADKGEEAGDPESKYLLGLSSQN